jgi:glyoxylate/hydroxypyruvate reductase A
MNTIVFISNLAPDLQDQWIVMLKELLNHELILLPQQISESQVKDIDIAIVANPDPKYLTKYPNLVWVQSLWAGVERLISEPFPNKVKLVKLVDPQLAKTMAESVLAWTLYLQRNMPEYTRQQRNQQWCQLPNVASEDLRVSVLGAGALGIAALNALSKLDYQVNCWSRTSKNLNNIRCFTDFSGLQTMLSQTDILINLLPLTKNTHHLLDKTLLSQLPYGAKLINFSRGAVIDTTALLELLDTGHLSHAVLDVFEHEPLAPHDPIWCNPKITVLPHISAPTNMCSAVKVVANNINMYRKDNVIPNSVDVKAGY